jgi:uncharacterized protein YqjF (DUF2071 family)
MNRAAGKGTLVALGCYKLTMRMNSAVQVGNSVINAGNPVDAPRTLWGTRSRAFLTAMWRDIAIVNWLVSEDLLSPFVPVGTALDTWRGKSFVSLVAFRFVDTRILRIPVPFHVAFEEVNLRFYVKRLYGAEVRRGVVFVKEIVPRACVAWLARALFNEPYVAAPMVHRIDSSSDLLNVRYDWTVAGKRHSLALSSDGLFRQLDPASHEEFITEHYWGYSKRRGGGTTEYQVAHPKWQVASAHSLAFDCDSVTLYGDPLGRALYSQPFSVFLASGSDVSLSFGRRI